MTDRWEHSSFRPSPNSSLCSIWWLTSSICICIGQELAEPLRRKLYQAPVSKHFLASAIVSGFGDYMGHDNSVLKFLRWAGGPIPQPGAMPIRWIWFLQVLSSLCWVFWLMASLLGSGNILLPWHLELSSGYSQLPIPYCYTPCISSK